MRKCPANRLIAAAVIPAAVFWLLLPAPAAAAAGDWRPTYDTVMMWINFIILTAVLIKLLRHPLGNFFKTQRDSTARTLDALEGEKHRIASEIQSLRRTLEDRQQKVADLHTRIVAAGREERQEVIAAAKREADRRLLKARQLIEAHQREACRRLRNEMIDSAVLRAMAELPGHMTPEVEQALTERFLRSIAQKKA
jgi:F-type H+-transporting ATPase subunit b